MTSTAVLAVSIVTTVSFAQDRAEVSLKYLHRHGVPCSSILRTGVDQFMDDVVTSEDGSEWILFWLEDEVAFVQPRSHRHYRWRQEIFAAWPKIYGRQTPVAQGHFSAGD